MKAIRPISPNDDLSAVVQVLNRSHGTVAKMFGFTRETNPSNNAFIDEATLRVQLNSSIRLYGLSISNELIGCIAIEKSSSEVETYYIEKVSVLPEFRHRGFGIELMTFATELIREAGGSYVSIALIDSHDILKSWYLSQGFEQSGVKAYGHLPFSVCFMRKQLIPSKA